MNRLRARRVAAYAVHLLTASGVLLALAAAIEVASAAPDPRRVLLVLAAAIVIDAIDGPLARAAHVERHAPAIAGRTIDDIVDYLCYAFLPLLLVLRMGWAAGPEWLVLGAIGFALIASLFGFAHRLAKDDDAGFFRGFPSYWNVAAWYFGLWAAQHGFAGRVLVTASLVALAALTLAPLRFLYLNRAPAPWRVPMTLGAVVWGVLLVGTLPWYPSPADPDGAIPPLVTWLSLAYPAWYAVASVRLIRS